MEIGKELGVTLRVCVWAELKKAAKLAMGDGGLGFWSALAEVYPETCAQRC